MDAKSIYIADGHMKSQINWDNSSGNEWSFVGEGCDFKEEEVQTLVDSFFTENELYLAIDRHSSHAVQKQKTSAEVKFNLANQNVMLCNDKINKIVELNYVGGG